MPTTREDAEERIKKLQRTARGIKPCDGVKFSCCVEWDVDEGEESLSPYIEFVIGTDKLSEAGILDKRKWRINETMLEDFLPDYISDLTGFCHKGFTFNFKPHIKGAR